MDYRVLAYFSKISGFLVLAAIVLAIVFIVVRDYRDVMRKYYEYYDLGNCVHPNDHEYESYPYIPSPLLWRRLSHTLPMLFFLLAFSFSSYFFLTQKADFRDEVIEKAQTYTIYVNNEETSGETLVIDRYKLENISVDDSTHTIFITT